MLNKFIMTLDYMSTIKDEEELYQSLKNISKKNKYIYIYIVACNSYVVHGLIYIFLFFINYPLYISSTNLVLVFQMFFVWMFNFYEWAKRMKFLLAVIYWLPRPITCFADIWYVCVSYFIEHCSYFLEYEIFLYDDSLIYRWA